MPSRNIIKINLPGTYYHVYGRGVNKQQIFHDEDDYQYFLSLFDRYLSPEISTPLISGDYTKLVGTVELLSYCLMPNHYHLLIYQVDTDGMSKLMRGIVTSYSRYINKKYKRSGPIFESTYKASCISADDHLLHISRYIHRNHEEWMDYPYSSIRAYLYDDVPDWLVKFRVADRYKSAVKYLEFLDDVDSVSEDVEI